MGSTPVSISYIVYMMLGISVRGKTITSKSQKRSTTQLSHFEEPPCFTTSRFLFKSMVNNCNCEISRRRLSSIFSCAVIALIKEPDSFFRSQFSSPSSFEFLSSSFDLLSRLCANYLNRLAVLWEALLLRSASLTYSANSNVNDSISSIFCCS